MRRLLKHTADKSVLLNRNGSFISAASSNNNSFHNVLRQYHPAPRQTDIIASYNCINNNSVNRVMRHEASLRSYSSSGHDTKRESFLDSFRKQFKQDLASDEKYSKLKEELDKDTTMQVARKTGEAAKRVKDAATGIIDKSALAMAARSQKILDNKFVSSAIEGVSKTADTVAEQRLVKFVLDEYFVDEQERQQFHFHFRSGYGRKKDAERGIYYNPYTQQMENMEHVKINEEEMGVSVFDADGPGARRRREKFSGMKNALTAISSKMEGTSNPLAAMTRRVIDNTKDAVDRFGDTVFKANEHTESLKEFYERNDTFNLETFLKDVEYIMIPKILQAYFEDDVETLRYYVTDECWRGHLYPRVQARIASKVKFDTAILDIRDVDLMAARYAGDIPVLVISSQMQYIYCVKDKMGEGDIVEGARDDIRSESIFWIFRQDPTEETHDFEIMELSFGGSARIT